MIRCEVRALDFLESDLVRAGSGVDTYPNLIEATVSRGLAGLHHFVGIPSTVGGAMWQNLHFLSPAPERERTIFIEEMVEAAEILTEEGKRCTVDRDYFDFGYDYSILHERDDVVLSVHNHDDLGLAVANSLSGVLAGARQVEVAVNGIGERAGNVPLEDVVLSLLCQYGIDLGIRTELLCETSKYVLEHARVPIPGNRPIVGDMLYQVESGIVAGFVRKARAEHPLEYVPFSAELVGQKPVTIVLGKNSGLPSIQEWCEKLKIQASEKEMMEMLAGVKEKSYEKKDLLTVDEFKTIVDGVLSKSGVARK